MTFNFDEVQNNNLVSIFGNLYDIETTIGLDLESKGSHIPPEIAKLKNLKRLSFGYSNLTFIPREIFELENLEYLDLEGNSITHIPPEIAKLKNLKVLDLDGNELTKLPPELGECENLVDLYVPDNNIKSIPYEFSKLKNLEGFLFSYSQKGNFPQDVEVEYGNNIIETKNFKEFMSLTSFTKSCR